MNPLGGRCLALFVAVVATADRLTKAVVTATMTLGESLEVVPGFFSISYVRNPGGAFGLLAGLEAGLIRPLFITITFVAVGALAWLFLHTDPRDRTERIGLAAICGGALGNLYDRVVWGEVVDFLDFYVGQWHWPAFNVADSFITLGAVALLVSPLLVRRSRGS